jgi:hypothetical protein
MIHHLPAIPWNSICMVFSRLLSMFFISTFSCSRSRARLEYPNTKRFMFLVTHGPNISQIYYTHLSFSWNYMLRVVLSMDLHQHSKFHWELFLWEKEWMNLRDGWMRSLLWMKFIITSSHSKQYSLKGETSSWWWCWSPLHPRSSIIIIGNHRIYYRVLKHNTLRASSVMLDRITISSRGFPWNFRKAQHFRLRPAYGSITFWTIIEITFAIIHLL